MLHDRLEDELLEDTTPFPEEEEDATDEDESEEEDLEESD